jgi:hypothetical protein
MTSSWRRSTAGAPPLTGASITETPRTLALSARLRQVLGCTVLCTTMIEPGCAPASKPSGPAASVSTSSSATTHKQMMSLPSANTAGESATFADVSA